MTNKKYDQKLEVIYERCHREKRNFTTSAEFIELHRKRSLEMQIKIFLFAGLPASIIVGIATTLLVRWLLKQ